MDVTSLRRVGNSDLRVTPLGFGGGTIGSPHVTNQDSLATVSVAWDSGVRLFDTAPWYGVGRSERRLGLALSALGPREEYRINTKVGRTLIPEPVRDETNKTFSPGGDVRTPRDAKSGFRVHFSYKYDRLHEQHLDSLQRLGHSSVDSLTIHDLDLGYHSADQIEQYLDELSRDGGGGARALEELRSNGSIKAIGCGCNLEGRNAYSWQDSAHEDLIDRIVDVVELDFLVVAGPYTLLETRGLRRLLPMCQRRGIGVIIASPYAGGWLAKPDENALYMYDQAPKEIIERSRAMHAICQKHDVPLAAAAIQFPLAHPAVAAVIPGAKTPHEAAETGQRMRLPVPGDVWSEMKSQGLLDPEAPTPE